ncbi:MAG: glycine cleavage system H protein [Desulfobacterales bacterium]
MEIQGYVLPDDLYYEKNHFWVKNAGDVLIMGMTDFAQQLSGEIVYVQLPFEGKQLKLGKKFAKIESGKWLGKVYAPVSGELIESNPALETEPGLINRDCYGLGWMYKIRPDDIAETAQLIHGREAVEEWMLAEIIRYKKE